VSLEKESVEDRQNMAIIIEFDQVWRNPETSITDIFNLSMSLTLIVVFA